MPLERVTPSDPINESEAPPENQYQEIVRPTIEIQQGIPQLDSNHSLEKTLKKEPQSHDVLTSEPNGTNLLRRSKDNGMIESILEDKHNFHNEIEHNHVLALIKAHLNVRLRLQSILKGLPCPPLTNPIIMSQDYIENFEKRQLPKADSTSILHLEWYLAHKEKNPSTTAEIIPELESQIECDPISLHERNETTPEALGKTFGDLTIEELFGIYPNVPPKILVVPKSNVKIHTTKGSQVPHDHPVMAQPKCQNYSLTQRLLRSKSARLQ